MRKLEAKHESKDEFDTVESNKSESHGQMTNFIDVPCSLNENR